MFEINFAAAEIAKECADKFQETKIVTVQLDQLESYSADEHFKNLKARGKKRIEAKNGLRDLDNE